MTAQYDDLMEQSEKMRRLIASGRNPSSMIKARAEGMMESVTEAKATIASTRTHTASIGREMDTLKSAHGADAIGNDRATAVRPPLIQAKKTTNQKIPM